MNENQPQNFDSTDLDSLHSAVKREKPDVQPGHEPAARLFRDEVEVALTTDVRALALVDDAPVSVRVAPADGLRPIGRAVVGHENLVVVEALRQSGVESGLEVGFPVVDRDGDRGERVIVHFRGIRSRAGPHPS